MELVLISRMMLFSESEISVMICYKGWKWLYETWTENNFHDTTRELGVNRQKQQVMNKHEIKLGAHLNQ